MNEFEKAIDKKMQIFKEIVLRAKDVHHISRKEWFDFYTFNVAPKNPTLTFRQYLILVMTCLLLVIEREDNNES